MNMRTALWSGCILGAAAIAGGACGGSGEHGDPGPLDAGYDAGFEGAQPFDSAPLDSAVGFDSSLPFDSSVPTDSGDGSVPDDGSNCHEGIVRCGPLLCDTATQYCEVAYSPIATDAGPSYSCETLPRGCACSCACLGMSNTAPSPGSCGCYASTFGQITYTFCPP